MRNPKGFTLVEVLVGSTLVAITVAAIFVVFGQGAGLDRRDMLRRRAFQELEKAIEKPEYSYRSPFYLALATGNKPDTTVSLSNQITGTLSVRIDAVTYTFNSVTIPTKTVTARLSWNDGGQAYAESLQTVVTLVDIN